MPSDHDSLRRMRVIIDSMIESSVTPELNAAVHAATLRVQMIEIHPGLYGDLLTSSFKQPVELELKLMASFVERVYNQQTLCLINDLVMPPFEDRLLYGEYRNGYTPPTIGHFLALAPLARTFLGQMQMPNTFFINRLDSMYSQLLELQQVYTTSCQLARSDRENAGICMCHIED